jgi:hypothetical protein
MLEDPRIRRSTMMGYPCLRFEDRFFVSFDPRADAVVIKLPQQRVRKLVVEGLGYPLAPTGRVFRKWISLPPESADAWDELVEDARKIALLHEPGT